MFSGWEHCPHFSDVLLRAIGFTEFHVITENSKLSTEQNLKYKFKIVKVNFQR